MKKVNFSGNQRNIEAEGDKESGTQRAERGYEHGPAGTMHEVPLDGEPTTQVDRKQTQKKQNASQRKLLCYLS